MSDATITLRLDDAGAASDPMPPTRVILGRGADCDVRLDSPLVSRQHAEIALDDGRWMVRDLGSANGTMIDGRRIDHEQTLAGHCTLQLGGARGPALNVSVGGGSGPGGGLTIHDAQNDRRRDEPVEAPAASPADDTLDGCIAHYLSKDVNARGIGEQTRLIRRAFATVDGRRSRRAALTIAVAVLLALVGSTWAYRQYGRIARLKEAARELFDEMKAIDLQIGQLKVALEEQGGRRASAALDRLEQTRRRMSGTYDSYLEDLGIYRGVSETDRLILQVARAFGESEVALPSDFVANVHRTLGEHWLTPDGRRKFADGIARATRAKHVEHVVRALAQQGLGPHYFYLALQESGFDPKAIGPVTRWGRAKGMWQLVPATATRFGLRSGARANDDVVDVRDERFDAKRATMAAARYLHSIHTSLAQASGLLVVASYNWGEGNVARRIGEPAGPDDDARAALEGTPETPGARSYWRFLEEHADRIPRETRDYVLRVFAAAVIGEDPRRFGFDFDPPLRSAAAPPGTGAAAASAPASAGRTARAS